MGKHPYYNILRVIQAMRRGLTSNVAPGLRAAAVDVDWGNERYISYFYYDCPIDDELFELASCAATEASGSWQSEEHILEWPAPNTVRNK